MEGEREIIIFIKSPDQNSTTLLSRMVGEPNESKIYVNSVETVALIDTGSMVTCMSEQFYHSFENKPLLHDIEDFELKVYSAEGSTLPFLGYVEVELKIPFLSAKPIYAPVLVTKGTEYSSKVPIIVGTNIIKICKEFSQYDDLNIPDEWELAFSNLETSEIPVKTTNRYSITIGPHEVKTLSGIVKSVDTNNVDTAITEQIDTFPNQSLLVCPRVVSIKVGKTSRVPVRICNMSAQAIKIQPKSVICKLSTAKVVDAWEPTKTKVSQDISEM